MVWLNMTDQKFAPLLTSPCWHNVFEFLPPIEGAPIFEHHDMANLHGKWGQDLKVNATDPMDFLKTQSTVITCQIFLELASPETKAVLENVLKISKGDAPFGFQLFAYSRLGRHTNPL
jgi:hypothetical protein